MKLVKMLLTPPIAAISVVFGLVFSAAASCTVTVSVANPDDGTATVSSATVEEGASVTITATPTADGKAFNYWTGTGCFPQRLTHDASATFKVTEDCELVAHFATAYYVKTDGDDSKDGLTPATAKATVAAAVNAAQAAGDEAVVLVAAGTYKVTKAAGLIDLTKAVTVRGMGATRDDVVLMCTVAGVLVTISEPSAALMHLTLSGNGTSTKCKAANLTAGLIADCHITNFYDIDVSSVANATVYLQGEGSALVGSTVNDNQSYSQTACAGGGVGMTAGTLVEDCLIYGNSCTGTGSGGGNRHGGGVFMSGGTLRRSLIAGNMHRIAGSGLSVFTGSECLVEDCTIVDNFVNMAGGSSIVYGVQRRGTGTGVLKNCIITGNTAWQPGEYNVQTNAQGEVAGLTFENCAFGHETVVGVDNVVARPVFADPENFDYSVGAGSCANKGYRPLAANKLQAGFTLASDGAADESVVTLTAVTSGDAAGATYAWMVTDADSGRTVYEASGDDKAVVTPTLASGVYTVSLTVTTAAETATFTGRKALTVQSTETFVTTAADSLTLKEAIRRTADGGTVYVADGTYYYEENIAIDRPVSVISENGPAVTKLYVNPQVTFFDKAQCKPCFYFKHEGAKMYGFELRCVKNKNGASQDTGHGITYHCYGGGEVSNCVYHGFSNYRGAGHAVYASGAVRIVDCVIRNGVSTDSSSSVDYCGLGLYLDGADCLADRCVITNNKYTATGKDASTAGGGVVLKNGATLRNSCVANNQHARGGGGVYLSASTLENCTVLGNSVMGNANKGYGVYAEGASVLRNNIIRDNMNTANAAEQNVFATEDVTVEYNDYPEDSSSVAAKGEGNIDQDPVFDGDSFLLTRDSPCKDKAKEMPWMTDAIDLKGDPRIAYGIPDIGCYEYYVPATVEETLEVTSPYGEIGGASPAYGENKGIYGGRSFTASVSEAVTNEEAGVAYECTGWKLYDADGVEKDAGTGSSFTYTHPNPAEFRRLEWRFDRVFRVRQSYAGLSSAPPSTVTWVREGASVSLAATGSETGKAFNFWAGADEMGERTLHEASAAFVPVGPVDVVAQYSQVYYVKTDGDDAKDGLTPETAKATVAGAVNAVQDLGDDAVVLVAPGTYTVTNAAGLVSITKSVTVRGTGATRDEVVLHSGYANATYLVTLNHRNAAIFNLRLEGEKTTETYGGLMLAAGLVSNCEFTKFKGYHNGGWETQGVPVYMTGGQFVDSRIFGNSPSSAYGSHAGIEMSAGLVENCEIVDNVAGGGPGGNEADRRGGGVFMNGGTLRNCLVAGNMQPIAASGIAIRGGTPVVENCTIAGNFYDLGTTTRIVRGVEQNGGTATFSKCIIAGNTSFGQPYANVNAKDGVVTGITFTDTCFGGETVNGEGNITADPLFADPENGDYSVGYGAWDGWGYNPSKKAFRVGFTVTSDGVVDSSVVTLTAQVKGDTEGIVYTWMVRDADTDALVYTAMGHDKATIVPTLPTGVYTVTLTATNGSRGADTFTAVKCFTVYGRATTVSAAEDSPGLQAMIDRTADGGTVTVEDGVYTLTRRLDIARGIKVVSQNGPAVTKLYITANTSVADQMHTKPMVAIDDAESLLAGFELRHANSTGTKQASCHGMAYTYRGGTVSNCFFNAGKFDRSSYMCAHSYGPAQFLDCVICNASLQPSGNNSSQCGLGITLETAEGLVDRCVISNCCYTGAGTTKTIAGGGIKSVGGTVRNSLIVGNQHGLGGGGIYANGGLVENCTVMGNKVIYSGETGQKDYGLYADNGAVIRNCIVRGNSNTADNVDRDLFADESTTVEYNDYPEDSSSVAAKGEGNIDQDPVFKPGTYRLRMASPCVNAGKPGEPEPGALDLFGRPRVVCGRVDMGCHEFQNFGMMIMVR